MSLVQNNPNPVIKAVLQGADGILGEFKSIVTLVRDVAAFQLQLIKDGDSSMRAIKNKPTTLEGVVKQLKGPYYDRYERFNVSHIMQCMQDNLLIGSKDENEAIKELNAKILQWNQIASQIPSFDLDSDKIEPKRNTNSVIVSSTIWEACQNGDLEFLKTQIASLKTSREREEFLNSKNSEGATLLHVTAVNGHTNLVQWLLENGANRLMTDNRGYLAFHLAAQKGFVEIVRIFLDAKVPINAKGEYGRTALFTASYNNHPQVCELLIQRGADVNSQAEGNYFSTPLHEAVVKNNRLVVITLMSSQNLDVNIEDLDKHSPLYYAVMSGLIDLCILITTHPSYQMPTDPVNPNHIDQLLQAKIPYNAQAIRHFLQFLKEKNTWQERSQKRLKALTQTEPDLKEAGEIHLQQKNYNKAIEKLDSILRLNPRSGESYFVRGFANFQKGIYNKAIQDFDLVTNRFSDDSPLMEVTLYYRAMAYFQKKDFDSALREFQTCIQKNFITVDLFTSLGELYLAKGDFSNAGSTFSKALKLCPGSAEILKGQASAYQAQSQFEKALDNYKQLLELTPSSKELLKNLVSVLSEMQRYDTAKQYLDEFVKKNANFNDPELKLMDKTLTIAVALLRAMNVMDELSRRLKSHLDKKELLSTTEAIFRTPGSVSKVEALLTEVNRRQVMEINFDPYSDDDLASVIKKLLMEMPTEHFTNFRTFEIDNVDLSKPAQAIEKLRQKIRALPKAENEFCKKMLLLLKAVYDYSWAPKNNPPVTNMIPAISFFEMIFSSEKGKLLGSPIEAIFNMKSADRSKTETSNVISPAHKTLAFMIEQAVEIVVVNL